MNLNYYSSSPFIYNNYILFIGILYGGKLLSRTYSLHFHYFLHEKYVRRLNTCHNLIVLDFGGMTILRQIRSFVHFIIISRKNIHQQLQNYDLSNFRFEIHIYKLKHWIIKCTVLSLFLKLLSQSSEIEYDHIISFKH